MSEVGDHKAQIRWMLAYIRENYGDRLRAWSYDGGGWLPPGITRVRNDTDAPEPVEKPERDDS